MSRIRILVRPLLSFNPCLYVKPLSALRKLVKLCAALPWRALRAVNILWMSTGLLCCPKSFRREARSTGDKCGAIVNERREEARREGEKEVGTRHKLRTKMATMRRQIRRTK